MGGIEFAANRNNSFDDNRKWQWTLSNARAFCIKFHFIKLSTMDHGHVFVSNVPSSNIKSVGKETHRVIS